MSKNYTLNDNLWLQIKNDYICGIQPKELSEKHNVSYDTLRSRIKREGWVQEKSIIEKETASKSLELTTEKLAEIQLHARQQYAEIFCSARNKITRILEKTADPVQIATLINALQKCQKGEFSALGIKDHTVENNSNTTIVLNVSQAVEGWGNND